MEVGNEFEDLNHDEVLVSQQVPHPRQGWAEDFEAMAKNGDDRLLDGDVYLPTRFDEEEWEWEFDLQRARLDGERETVISGNSSIPVE